MLQGGLAQPGLRLQFPEGSCTASRSPLQAGPLRARDCGGAYSSHQDAVAAWVLPDQTSREIPFQSWPRWPPKLGRLQVEGQPLGHDASGVEGTGQPIKLLRVEGIDASQARWHRFKSDRIVAPGGAAQPGPWLDDIRGTAHAGLAAPPDWPKRAARTRLRAEFSRVGPLAAFLAHRIDGLTGAKADYQGRFRSG